MYQLLSYKHIIIAVGDADAPVVWVRGQHTCVVWAAGCASWSGLACVSSDVGNGPVLQDPSRTASPSCMLSTPADHLDWDDDAVSRWRPQLMCSVPALPRACVLTLARACWCRQRKTTFGQACPSLILHGAVASDGVARDLLLVAAPREVFVWDLAQIIQADASTSSVREYAVGSLALCAL